MSIITRNTAAAIAYAHAEIEASRGLLEIIAKGKADRVEPDFRDVFGKRRGSLQLGVPSGDTGHRLLDVSADLGGYVIEAHIGKMQAKLTELCQIARMELDGEKTA